MPELRRLGIAAENPARLAAFYQAVFDLEKIAEQDGAVFLSDGAFNLALTPVREGAKRPDRIPFAENRVHDPEGNGFDISEKGWKV